MKKTIKNSYVLTLLVFIVYISLDTFRVIFQLVHTNTKFMTSTLWGLYIEDFGNDIDSNIIITFDFIRMLLNLIVVYVIVLLVILILRFFISRRK